MKTDEILDLIDKIWDGLDRWGRFQLLGFLRMQAYGYLDRAFVFAGKYMWGECYRNLVLAEYHAKLDTFVRLKYMRYAPPKEEVEKLRRELYALEYEINRVAVPARKWYGYIHPLDALLKDIREVVMPHYHGKEI